jgi:hypothetical protein
MLQECSNRRFSYLQEIAAHQVDVARAGDIAIEIFKMTSVIARTSRNCDERLDKCEIEFQATKNLVYDSWMNVKKLVWEIENSPYFTNESRNEAIHSRNLKYGGYFAYSPLDRVHY